MERLHALASRLLAEDLAHFRVHADSNDLVHVFEHDGATVGFQFWRTEAMDLPGCRAILGGKLRVLPEHRGRALHLWSGLRFYLRSQLHHPLTRFYRLSLASLFGFVSITSALAEFQLFDAHAGDPEGRAVRATFERIAAQSHYRLDPETSLFFVDIRYAPDTLARYPQSYYDRPEARLYERVNPGYRENGSYAAFWFRFTPRNLVSLVRTILRKRRALSFNS